MLKVCKLETGYGRKQVLFGISLEAAEGHIVALIGPNGAGKSTVLKAICGLLPTWRGQILFDGVRIDSLNPAQNVSQGVILSPQGNRVFNDLTVLENLEIGGIQLRRDELCERVDEVFELFPSLKPVLRRDAAELSGGEQQMLALARTLIMKPRLLLLDEPSLGLSPAFVNSVFDKVCQINRDKGIPVLIVEQKVRDVLAICHRVYAFKLGQVAFKGMPSELDPEKLRTIFL